MRRHLRVVTPAMLDLAVRLVMVEMQPTFILTVVAVAVAFTPMELRTATTPREGLLFTMVRSVVVAEQAPIERVDLVVAVVASTIMVQISPTNQQEEATLVVVAVVPLSTSPSQVAAHMVAVVVPTILV